MKRRTFLGVLLATLGSIATASFAYPLLRFFAPPRRTVKPKQVIIKKDEVPVGDRKPIILGETPVVVINRPGKGYIALSRICTHLGCLVEFDTVQKRLVCPCHAGTFDLSGHVLSGPPPAPLAEIPLAVEGDTIVVG